MSASGATPSVTPVRALRMILVASIVGILFGLLGLGEIVEDALRTDRARINQVEASGRVVLVRIDDKSQEALGRWPWSRSVQADILNRLHQAGAEKVLLDVAYDFPTTEADDAKFEAAVAAGPTLLPTLMIDDANGIPRPAKEPLPRFARHVERSTIASSPNWQMAVWDAYYAYEFAGERYPFASTLLAGQTGPAGETFKIDYRTRLESFPTFSAIDVLRRPLPDLRGKQVVIGLVSPSMGDQIVIPGRGRMGGVHVHVYATETLLARRPLVLGWIPSFLIALGLVGTVLRVQRTRLRVAFIVGGSVALLAAPIVLEPLGYILDIVPGLAVLFTATVRLVWHRYRERGLTNGLTGLPNFNALRQRGKIADKALIVARGINYPQLSSALDEASERLLVEQVVSRLGVGADDAPIYQGDEGLFAWMVDPSIAIGHHVEALHALFRSPARIGKLHYDLAISFGVELGSARSINSRLSSALVAADEAASEGLKWKYHDPERLKDSSWRLSLLTQLDTAIDNGEVWVAFQPQVDVSSGRVCGAEALARWTHPVKGPISPHEFISAAESNGRIDRLTLFMLDKAIAAAAEVNRKGQSFDIAVNLSARTLARSTLAIEVKGLLDLYGLPPERLTLELTETSALSNDGSDLVPLMRLRDLGVRISIDDYGTGMSTLEYLRKVPASELKIDQSFIRGMRDNRSDLLMVRSTINLAHSLQRTVVAEGVEDERTLDALKQMGCDKVQGFLVGRPMSFQSLSKRLTAIRKGQAA